MKVGFQTILWGPEFEDIEHLRYLLGLLHDFHFQGIEVFQAPSVLPPVRTFEKMLTECGLRLVGMSGGKVVDRLRYCKGVLRPEYLYVETYKEEDAQLAAAEGISLALHPHLFAPIHRLGAALKELEKHPQLMFLPDTAHLAIAGDDPVEAIRRGWGRLAAVHLKDWTPIYGRSVHRYAKGFIELGAGLLSREIDQTIGELRRRDYEGWVIVEQDSSLLMPEASLRTATKWLSQEPRGLLPSPPNSVAPPPPPARPRVQPRPVLDATDFLRQLADIALRAGDRFYEGMAAAFARLIPCRFVSVWSYSPAYDTLSHLAYFPNDLLLSLDVSLERSKSMSRVALESKRPELFDLTEGTPGREYLGTVFPELIEQTQAEELWIVPVVNCHNPNQVRFLLNFSPIHHLDPNCWQSALEALAVDISRSADVALEERCSYAAASVSMLEGRNQGSAVFLGNLAREVARLTRSQGCSIFRTSEQGDRLECGGTTGIEWHVPQAKQYYERGSGLTGKCWELEESMLVNHAAKAEGWWGSSTETVTDKQRDPAIYVPMKLPRREGRSSKPETIGVIRCRTKERPNYFYSDDDVAVIDAAAQAAIPFLVALTDEERRTRALQRLTHELRVPIVAVGGALDDMQQDLEDYFNHQVPQLFREDYFSDALSWEQLMHRLLDNADLVSGRTMALQIRPVRTLMLRDVLAAAIRQVDRLKRRRKLRGSITHGPFDQIPELNIDRNLFQQAFFNLLSNAVKYAYSDPDAFAVEVLASTVAGGFEIRFRDWGTGVDAASADKIFDLGVRGRDRTGLNVGGQGIGLWVVRRVVEAHSGRVWLSCSAQPTEFTIFLPSEVEYGTTARRRRNEK